MLAGEVPVVGRACGPLQENLLGKAIIAAWEIRANDPNDRSPKKVQSVERQAPHAPHTKEEEETATVSQTAKTSTVIKYTIFVETLRSLRACVC